MSGDTLITDLAKQANKPPPAVGLGIASATIKDFDTTTFGNRLDYYGTELVDVPVLSGTDALSYRPGDEVILQTWHPVDGHRRRGLGSYYILGRVVRPGAANAQRTIQFLQTELAKQIVDELVEELLVSPAGQDLAAFVFAQRFKTAEVAASGGTSSATYTETLAGGDGPIVTDVPISESGLAVVGVQAQISIIADPALTRQAYISYRVTGATIRSASDANAKRTDIGDTDAASITNVTDQSMSWSLQSGLNPGLHTFETMYRSNYASAFAQRRIIVIAL